MNGRNKFEKFKYSLYLVSKALRITPVPFRHLIWDISSPFGNKLAIGLRYSLLKSMAKDVGENVYIGKYVVLKNIQNINIGNNVSIHDYCYLDAAGQLSIGSNVSIAHNCSILTTNHQWSDKNKPIKYNNEVFESVNICDDVWLGCGVRVLAGVTISSRSVLAAGSIANKNIQGNSVYAGVPAKLIKTI